MAHHVAAARSPAMTLAALLELPDVEEHCDLRGRVGFMAYHGGALEEMTDRIAGAAARNAGASYYAVVQPPGMRHHISSVRIDPAESRAMTRFLHHVDTVITVHGYGRAGYFTSILLGGANRAAAGVVGAHLRRRLPAYRVVTDLEQIPADLRGVHHRNPANLTRGGGVQVELPPRVRGSGPLWWDHEPGRLTPHTEALIDGLADAAAALAAAPEPAVR